MILSDAILINPPRKIEKKLLNPFIAMEDIEPNYRFVQSKTKRESNAGSKFKNGDTLLARITPSLENGKTAYVDSLEDEKIGLGSTEFIVLSGKPGITENLFVYYIARTPEFRNAAIQSMTGTSGRQRVQETVFDDFEIEIPDISVQLKIINILGKIDDKIKNLRDSNLILEKIIQSIFKSWFIDFDGQTEFEDSELGQIPKGWSAGEIRDIIKLFDYQRIPLSEIQRKTMHGFYPYYGASGIIDHINKYIFDGEYVLIPEDGENLRSKKLPMALIAEGKFWVNNHAHIIQGKNNFSNQFIWVFFKNLDFSPWITGAAQPKLNQQNLLSIPTIIPDSKTLVNFDLCTKHMFKKIQDNLPLIKILEILRNSLLPKLMSGEIKVKV